MIAMILAAGIGSRLKPITDHIPKALVPIDGIPVLQHIILKLKSAGCNHIIINTHHFSQQIVDFVKKNNHFGIRIELSDESHQLLDTGGALKKIGAQFDIDQPILIHNVDILSDIDLQYLYQKHTQATDQRLATLLISHRETQRYLLFDTQKRLKGWTNLQTGEVRPRQTMETKGLERYAFSGIQILSPQIFKLMREEKEVFPIIDFYMKTCHQDTIIGYHPTHLSILDIGKPKALAQAKEFLKNINY